MENEVAEQPLKEITLISLSVRNYIWQFHQKGSTNGFFKYPVSSWKDLRYINAWNLSVSTSRPRKTSSHVVHQEWEKLQTSFLWNSLAAFLHLIFYTYKIFLHSERIVFFSNVSNLRFIFISNDPQRSRIRRMHTFSACLWNVTFKFSILYFLPETEILLLIGEDRLPEKQKIPLGLHKTKQCVQLLEFNENQGEDSKRWNVSFFVWNYSRMDLQS